MARLEALSDLGLSSHNTIVSATLRTITACWKSASSASPLPTAVDVMRPEADLTLKLPDGQGAAELHRGRLVAGALMFISGAGS
jgi:hypothetical protein